MEICTKCTVIFGVFVSLVLYGWLYIFLYNDFVTKPSSYNTIVPNASNDMDRYGIFSNFTSVRSLRIGILIPTTTRRIKKPKLNSLSLVQVCLPPLLKTLESNYTYSIYIGIDKGDYLENKTKELRNISAHIITLIVPSEVFSKTVNYIARRAYIDGMDYLVRINDDTEFHTQYWTSIAIKTLLSYVPPNIGVVGPFCAEGNTQILVHDMVHRTHLDIFPTYYPAELHNWFTDDWMTHIYMPNKSTKIALWKVRHHVKMHGRRYIVEIKPRTRLSALETLGMAKVKDYIKQMKTSDIQLINV